MKNIIIIFIISFVSINVAICQDLLNSYSAGVNAITPARIKYFDNHVYIAANITINNQTFPSIIKLDNIGNIIWQTRLDQPGIVSDLEFVPQSGISSKAILLVGESESSPMNLDNKSFIWKVEDINGTHILSKFYNHTGIEGFTRIVLHPNPLNSSFKYYIVGKRNVAFPATQQNPSHSFKTILYNIDENLNINWSKNIEITSFLTSGNQANFYNSILPNSNGNITLLGAESIISSQLIAAGSRIEVNPNNQTGFGYRSSRAREYREGLISNGQLHIAGHLFDAQGGFLGSDVSRGNGGSLGTGQKYISFLTGHNGITSIGNDLYTINVKIGNPNGGKIMINKYQFAPNPTYSLNYINSVAITPSGITTPFGNQQISSDASGNIIFSTSSNGILYFGEINNTLISSAASSCYLGNTFSPTNDNDDGGGYQWRFLTETNSVSTLGQGISFSLTKTSICSPPAPCVLTVGFTHTPGNCGAVTFTPTVTGGTGPYTYAWDIGCNGIDFTTTNPTYSYPFPASGTYDVCLTVTDASEFCMGSKTMSITVIKDNIAPVITCPVGNISLNNNPEYCYASYGGVSATDNCGTVVSITCVLTGATTGTFSNVSQIQYNKGVTTVICTATDDSGNVSAPCTFTVTVFDTSPPFIDCPNDISVTALPCDNSAAVTFPPPTVYDNCPMWTSSCDYMSGDLFPCGNTIVTCTVTDMGGAIASCSFNVNVVCSNSCPQITGSDISCGTSPNTLNYSVTIFNPNPTTNICTYTLSLPPAQGIINSTNPTTVGNTTTISGSLTPANNTISTFNLSIVASCTCNGNQQQTCNLSAILNNIEALPAPPQIICPPSITINTTIDECYSFYEDVSATDNCDPNPSVTCTLSGATIGVFTNVSGIQYNVGVTLVECVATDIDGATAQCSFTVTVVDEQQPSIMCPPNVSTQVTDCSNSAMVVFPPPVVSDNCPMPQYTCSHQSNDIFNCGNTLVTCIATDMAGNTATCHFEVDVACDCVDMVSSEIICDKATHTYLFSINIVNNSGMGSTCTSSVSLDPSQGVILNQTTNWVGNMGTITGVIQPTLVAPFTLNLSVVSECTCANGLTQNCTSIINYPITEICTEFVLFDKVYGDGGENYTSVIKAFGGGIYVAGYFLNSGFEVATFSKFDAVTGALLWEKKLSANTRIRDFDYNPDDPTTSAINEETLILVGHTTPLSTGGVDVNNKSFIIGLFPNGIMKFSKEFDFTGREQINKVERHKNPMSGFNFYAVGVRNQNSPSPIPSSWDQTFLINFDINGVVSWIRDYTYRSFPSGDDEILRGLIGLSDGSIIITGNDVPRNDGLIVRINGLNGAPIGAGDAVFANSPSPAIDFYDGLELPNGDIVLAGEWFGRHEAIICVFSKGTFSAVQTIKLIERFPGISKFEDIHIDANGDLYVIGHSKDNQLNPGLLPIIVKLSYHSGVLNILYSKYLLEGSENFFLNPSIHVTPLKDRIYYADTRNNLGFGFGLNDILIGAFDLNLTSNCAFNVPQTKLVLPISGSSFQISSSLNSTPGLNTINLIPLTTYQCADFCGPTCNVTALFEAIPITCYDMQFNDLSSGGTSPYTYAWDFNCDGGIPDASDPNPTWTFPGAGTYTVCLTVTDANGLCSSSTMQTVIVPPDTTDPDLICPPDITLNTDINQCYATYGGVSATDNCDASPDIVCTLTGATTGTFTNQSPLQYNKGVTMVSCTATDDSGNMVSCSFTVTVVDNQLPTIICPQNKVVNAPFCDGGANVTFDPPLISDNCPMASHTCTHASGDFFPCGTTVVTCTVTDMFGNTTSCSFNITVNCTCAQISQAEITCGTLPDTYDFVITVENLSGNGTSCNLSLILDPTQGAITNQVIIPTGNMSEISGTITPSVTIPDFFNFTIISECTCPDGAQISCTLPFVLASICCKSTFLTDDEMCKEAASHTITLGFNGSVTSITQVNWYISFSNPCPTDRMDPSWQLYASVVQNSPSVVLYPPYLSGDFCMYAVVSIDDNPCTELISDIAHFALCDSVKCTLPSQEYCYTGIPVSPAPIILTVGNAHCNFGIDWLDQNGNPIPGTSNQYSYQPPPIIWTAPLTDCKQVFNYSAQVTGSCGPEVCSTTITLFNESAPTGIIEIDPVEVIPMCQGEDLTLHFEPVCPEEPQPVTWKWLKGFTNATLNHIPQMGDMNPVINTNALYQDIWYGVEIKNGVCPPVRTSIFIDVIDPLKLLSFSANHIVPCRNNGVHMEITYGSDVCPITVKWYKDGFLIHTTMNVTGGFASYNYYNPSLNGDYSGNYSVIIESTCCPDQIRKSSVIKLAEPFILVVSGPCFRCNDDLVLLEAMVLNTSGVNCSFQWYEFIGSSYVPIPGETTPSIVLERAGQFKVIVQCGPCILEQEFSFPQCGTTGTNEPLSGQVKIFPNPTGGELFLHSNIEFKNSWELKIYNSAGESVKNIVMKGGIHEMSVSLHDFVNGIYYLQITDQGKILWSNQIIKVN